MCVYTFSLAVAICLLKLFWTKKVETNVFTGHFPLVLAFVKMAANGLSNVLFYLEN